MNKRFIEYMSEIWLFNHVTPDLTVQPTMAFMLCWDVFCSGYKQLCKTWPFFVVPTDKWDTRGMDCPGSRGRDVVISPARRYAKKVIQAHVANELKSEGSTDRKEFIMSKARGFFCFGRGAEEMRLLNAKMIWGIGGCSQDLG